MAVHLTAELLEGFTNTVLRKNFDGATQTPDFHRTVWQYCCAPDAFVAIAAPRSHAKSTAVTHAYTLAALLFKERDYAIIVSETTSQSIQFLGDIKKELLEIEDLRDLFGVGSLIKDTEDDLICRMEDGHLFRIQAKGAEQKMRGLKWKAKRPNLIVCDDLEGDEAVQNKEGRDKFKRWFYAALLPCRSETGIVRIVGTILIRDRREDAARGRPARAGNRAGRRRLEGLLRQDPRVRRAREAGGRERSSPGAVPPGR